MGESLKGSETALAGGNLGLLWFMQMLRKWVIADSVPH